MALIRLEGITKIYNAGSKTARVVALDNVNLEVAEGEFMAILGASGSGKSTMLHILGCLDRPTRGRYFLEGKDVARLGDGRLSNVRGRQLGFVFQAFNLIPQLNVLDNISLPMAYQGVPGGTRRKRARELARLVGLDDRRHHRPTQLSGGQKQRVAIARALANRPRILLADEPTGALDSRTGAEILDLLRQLNAQGHTIIIVTHDLSVANHTRRQIVMRDGRVLEDRATPAAAGGAAAETAGGILSASVAATEPPPGPEAPPAPEAQA